MAMRRNILDDLNNIEIMQRYRLDRDGLLALDQQLTHTLSPQTERNRSLSSMYKILITLRYLATGSIQLNYADILNVSQPTVSRVIAEVTDVLSSPNVTRQHIIFPTTLEQIRKSNQHFYGMANFPNVLGLIDGTQIQIQAPIQDEPAYINRLNYHSINTQVVVNAEDELIDVVARWPGGTHDSRVLRESGLYQLLDGGHLPAAAGHQYLLGDSGYACKRWLLTPYLNPRVGSQTNFNSAHKRTRSVVERTIGQLKRRWSVLHGEIKLEPIKACKVILSCGVLHNFCKKRNIPLLGDVPNVPPVHIRPIAFNAPQDGLRYREFIANTYF